MIAELLITVAFALGSAGYEGQPGNQSSGGGSNQAGTEGYEGQPGNQSNGGKNTGYEGKPGNQSNGG
jgi:hypothetical protein